MQDIDLNGSERAEQHADALAETVWSVAGSRLVASYVSPAIKVARGPKAKAHVRKLLASVESFVPHSDRDFGWFIVLSLTAGVCEEMLFRGGVRRDAGTDALVVGRGWSLRGRVRPRARVSGQEGDHSSGDVRSRDNARRRGRTIARAYHRVARLRRQRVGDGRVARIKGWTPAGCRGGNLDVERSGGRPRRART